MGPFDQMELNQARGIKAGTVLHDAAAAAAAEGAYVGPICLEDAQNVRGGGGAGGKFPG